MSRPFAISRAELRRLQRNRILECVFWFPVLVALGVAILVVEYRMMFFAIIAFGLSLIPLTYAWHCIKFWRAAEDLEVGLEDKRMLIPEWLEPVSGSVVSVETFPRFLRVLVNGTGLVDLPMEGGERERLLDHLTGQGLPIEAGTGPIESSPWPWVLWRWVCSACSPCEPPRLAWCSVCSRAA